MKFRLKDTIAYDGEWDFNSDLTMGEYHRIFLLTGIHGGDVWEAAGHGNVGVICALAAVALEQNGKLVDFDLLLKTKHIPELIGDTEEDDAGPPPQKNGSGASSDDAAKKLCFGVSSSSDSGTLKSATVPSVSGSESSERSSASAPETSKS